MNKQQRRELGEDMDSLRELYNQLEGLADDLDDEQPAGTAEDYVKQFPHIVAGLEGVQSNVNDQKSDEEGKYDNLPESWQNSEKGEAIQEIMSYLQEVEDQLQEAIDGLTIKRSAPYADLADDMRSVMGYIEEAIDNIDSAIAV